MKIRSKTGFNFLLLAFLSITFFNACFEPTEGCLDSNASNFEVLADDNCCCIYPSISVGLFHVVGEEDHHVDSIYTNDLGQEYRITAQSFYLTEMTLKYADGTNSKVIDTLELEIPQGSGMDVILEDNFGLIKHTTPAYSPGMIQENGLVTEVQFSIGLNEQARQLIPDQLTNSHPLGSNNAEEYYSESEGYIDMKWQIILSNVAERDTLDIAVSNFYQLVSVAVDPNIITEPGANSAIPLEVDLGKWLEGIDFADDIEQIKSGIMSNAITSFRITE